MAEAGTVKLPGVRALIVMIALAVFIHALDRGNFATAAPLIKDDLQLSNTQTGILLSAFFWTYVPGHLLAGWLTEQLGAARLLALALAVWSLATVLTGLATTFSTLLVLRLLLGLGESAGFPPSSKLFAQLVPPARLGAANGVLGAGLMLGNGVGVLLGGMILAAMGWQALFFVFGGLSLLWLVPWLALTRGKNVEARHSDAPYPGPAPGYLELLSRREVWGAMLGMFCANYPYFIVLSWLPLYLVKQQGFAIQSMALLGGAVYLIGALVNLLGGPLVDRMIARGGDPSRLRMAVILASAVIAVICMVACAIGSVQIAVGGLLLYSLSIGLGPIGTFTAGQTLGGPRAAGKWIALQNGAGGLSGVVGPAVTGLLIDRTGDYRIAFLAAAVVALAGLFFWAGLVRRIEPLEWSHVASKT